MFETLWKRERYLLIHNLFVAWIITPCNFCLNTIDLFSWRIFASKVFLQKTILSFCSFQIKQMVLHFVNRMFHVWKNWMLQWKNENKKSLPFLQKKRWEKQKKTKRINFCGNGWAPLLENIFYQNFRKLMTEPLNSEDRKLKINGLTIYGFWQLKTVHYWYHLNHLIYWASIETFPRRNKKFSKNKINFHFFNILLIYFIWNRIIIYSIQQERTLQYQKLFLQLLQNTNFLIGFKNEIQDHKTSS